MRVLHATMCTPRHALAKPEAMQRVVELQHAFTLTACTVCEDGRMARHAAACVPLHAVHHRQHTAAQHAHMAVSATSLTHPFVVA